MVMQLQQRPEPIPREISGAGMAFPSWLKSKQEGWAFVQSPELVTGYKLHLGGEHNLG